MTESTWAVALCEPNRDFEVDLRLRRSGYRVVFLTYRRQLTGHKRPGWRQASEFVGMPLLAGYLFVELYEGQPFPEPDRVPGYYGLMQGGKARVPGEIVADWQRRMFLGEFDDIRPYIVAQPRASFQPATTPEERRKLLEAKFSDILGKQEQAVG